MNEHEPHVMFDPTREPIKAGYRVIAGSSIGSIDYEGAEFESDVHDLLNVNNIPGIRTADKIINPTIQKAQPFNLPKPTRIKTFRVRNLAAIKPGF